MDRILRPLLGLSVLILVVALILVWNQSRRQEGLLQSQSARIHEMETQLKAVQTTAKNGTMEEQATCAQQAKRMFVVLGYSRRERNDGSDDFMSRYQPASHRCFMKIESSRTDAKGNVVSKSVVDAISREPLAVYMWINDSDKKYWEVPPMECFVFDLKGEKQNCKSDDEFEERIKQYMN